MQARLIVNTGEAKRTQTKFNYAHAKEKCNDVASNWRCSAQVPLPGIVRSWPTMQNETRRIDSWNDKLGSCHRPTCYMIIYMLFYDECVYWLQLNVIKPKTKQKQISHANPDTNNEREIVGPPLSLSLLFVHSDNLIFLVAEFRFILVLPWDSTICKRIRPDTLCDVFIRFSIAFHRAISIWHTPPNRHTDARALP